MYRDSMGLFIRADASPSIGTGHVMRCLALAQAAQHIGMPVRLAAHIDVPWVLDKLRQTKLPLLGLAGPAPAQEKPEQLLTLIKNFPETGQVVLDGYHFGPDCQKAVRNAGYTLLVIDDYAHLPEYSCDILLNQNLGAENLQYAGDIGKKFFGPSYALLRPEFATARRRAAKRIVPATPQNILLTLGGGDATEHLRRMAPMFALPDFAGRSIRVIRGAMREEDIRGCFAFCPASLEILHRVDDMPGLLLDTDLCITAGGSTCWELCCLGVPFLALVIAQNQEGIVNELEARKISTRLTIDTLRLWLGDSSVRIAASKVSAQLVSGNGAVNVVQSFGA